MKNVYFFGSQIDKGPFKKNLLGGKGANLAEMASMGFPVPPGFTIPTTVCLEYLEKDKYPESLNPEVKQAIKKIEKEVSRFFVDKKKSTFDFCKKWCSGLYARDDGYNFKSWPQS